MPLRRVRPSNVEYQAVHRDKGDTPCSNVQAMPELEMQIVAQI